MARGAKEFITDGESGDIIREALPLMKQRDYGDAVELMTQRVAQRFASNFGFSLDSAVPAPMRRQAVRRTQPGGGFPPQLAFIIFVIVVLVLSRGRGSGCLWLALASGNRGGWGGAGLAAVDSEAGAAAGSVVSAAVAGSLAAAQAGAGNPWRR